MTISELKRELEKLEKSGNGDVEVRTQVDVDDEYFAYGTSEIEYVTEWVVVETPSDFEGIMFEDNEAAQKEIDLTYEDIPLNERDDEELTTKRFFLIEMLY